MSNETLDVQKRDAVGTTAVRKLRRDGLVPAILYGHGEENVNLSIRADAIGNIIRHGTKMVALTGSVSETAILRDVQWDAFGIDVLHVDLTRVSRTEQVEVTLPIELHGEAPGTSEGGQLAFATHQVVIRCPAGAIPDHLQVNIGDLHIGSAIHASDIPLPDGADLVTTPSELIVQINKPSGIQEAGETDSEGGGEPELIGKQDEATGEAES